jgi:hypothetical protein
VVEVTAAGVMAPEKIEADNARLSKEIDDAETRKVSNLQQEAVNAEIALEKLTNMIAEAEAALAAYDAGEGGAASAAAALGAATI